MKRANLRRGVFVLVIAGALTAGLAFLVSEPADALVYEAECPNVPTCTSTEYLRIWGWCDEDFEVYRVYRYPWSSEPLCKVLN